jgi:MFS family permease
VAHTEEKSNISNEKMAIMDFLKNCKSTIAKATVSTFLLANAFVWYLCAFAFLQSGAESSTEMSLLLVTVNFLAFAVSAVLATKITRFTQNRGRVIKYWIISGIGITFSFLLLSVEPHVVVVAAGLVGAYFGLGIPTFMGYFSANTEPNNRGKFAGIAVLLIVLGYAIITAITQNTDPIIIVITLSIWLLVGLLSQIYSKLPEIKEQKDGGSFRSVITNKIFVLYIVPWLMFSLINDLTMQINTNYFNNLQLPYHFLIVNVIAGFSAVICGLLADRKGRKRLALTGFVLLGVGYASLGLFSGDIFGAWFYMFADGIAAGCFTTLFLITIWGDIAQERNSEKYYVIGLLPYLLSTLAGTTVGAYMAQVVSESTVFSFAAFFLFAATLPLFYAPETLPERLMKDRDLKTYIEDAKKKAKKDTEKANRKENKQPESELEKPEETDATVEDDKAYEEAKKLAEKYY